MSKETTCDDLILSYYLQGLDDLGNLQTGAIQPILEKYPSTKVEIQSRSIYSKYFKQFSWVEYKVHMDAVFCFCWHSFDKKDVRKPVFTKTRF